MAEQHDILQRYSIHITPPGPGAISEIMEFDAADDEAENVFHNYVDSHSFKAGTVLSLYKQNASTVCLAQEVSVPDEDE